MAYRICDIRNAALDARIWGHTMVANMLHDLAEIKQKEEDDYDVETADDGDEYVMGRCVGRPDPDYDEEALDN